MTAPTAAVLRPRPAGFTARQHHRAIEHGRADLFARMTSVMDAATAAGRDLLASEARDYDALDTELRRVDLLRDEVGEEARREETVDRSSLTPYGRPMDDGPFTRGQPLQREQRVADYVTARGLVRDGEDDLSLQKWLRGTITGDWHDADAERRTMLEGTLSAGGFLLPSPLSAEIIDRARNQSAVTRAGAQTVVMDASTLKMARIAADPTAVFHTEDAVIPVSDPVLETITFRAHTLAGLVKLSMELVEDAANVSTLISDVFAAVLALRLDAAALYGTGVDPEPTGVKNATGVTTLTSGTNGATPSYDTVIDAIGTLADNNFTASGIIDSPRTERTLGKLKDSTGQPLRVPDFVNSVPRFSTNQVPTNLTVGTSSDTSDIFTADWSNLLVGVRHAFSIQLLDERYADTGSIGLLAWWRGDVQLKRPKAFVVTTGVRP